MRVAIVLLLAISSCTAQDLPNAPSATKHGNQYLSPLKDPFFWSGTAFHASSVIADVHHTQSCERALTCVEANPGADVYKRRMIEIAGIAGMNYGCSLMLSEHKRWRAICMVVPVAVGILHWRDATRIYSSKAKP